jgi:tRNA (guanine-N7-)-methyltransferase
MVQPKNFKFPFSQESACIALHDGVFFIPPQVEIGTFQFPGWEAYFQEPAPVHVEFCSGNGSWIIEKALAFPSINWVAVEKRYDRVRKIWSKRTNSGIKNLLIVFGDARVFMKEYMPQQSVSEIYINFPDPWPKRRHAKHQIVNDLLFQEAKRVIIPEGRLIFVTDDEPYSSYFIERQQHCTSHFKQAMEKASVPENYGTSFFHDLFLSQGKKIHYHEIIY